MKIALINDTHAGARSDSLAFNEYFFRFWNNVFFPYLKEHNITHVVHLGDLVDRRKYVNYVILNHWRKHFMQRFADENITVDLIVGNHDVPYRNTNSINALDELFGSYPNITVYSEPCEKVYDGLPVLLLPWINIENQQKAISLINETKCETVFGHLEISGFEMDKGNVCHDGLNRDVFQKFDMVISGHFHHKSTDGRIWYLGTQYQITWSDFNDPKGFHVFDTDTRDLTFIKNPYEMFNRIVYDDKQENFDYKKIDLKPYAGSYLKIVVLNKTNPYIFDKFIDEVYKANPLDITIVEDTTTLTERMESDIVEYEDTMTILSKYVDALHLDLDNTKLKKLLKELYLESANLEQI